MAYKQRWLDYFELLDANGNGTIDAGDVGAAGERAEASGLFTPATLAQYKQHLAEIINHLIKEYDANKDGKITKEEWLAGIEKGFIGKSQEAGPAWWNDVLGKIFATVDKNNNGEISEDEYVKAVTTLSPTTSADAVRKAYNNVKGPGKFDVEVVRKLYWRWATSPDSDPEIDTLASPILRKH